MAAILKMEKLQYLQNRSTVFDQILHSDTHWASRLHDLSKYSNFQKFKMADGRYFLKKTLKAMSLQLFHRF